MRAPFYGLRGRRSRGPAAHGSRPERGPRRRDLQGNEQTNPASPDFQGPADQDSPQGEPPTTGTIRNHAPQNRVQREDGNGIEADAAESGQEEAHGRRRRGPGVRIYRRPEHD